MSFNKDFIPSFIIQINGMKSLLKLLYMNTYTSISKKYIEKEIMERRLNKSNDYS